MKTDENIPLQVESLCSGETLRGMVKLTVGTQTIVMDVAKAKEVSRMLAEATEAAISDELLVKFLTEKVGLDIKAAVFALRDFRIMRQGSAETVRPQ